MPLPKEILEADIRAELARDDLPSERRALLERGLRELQDSDDEYPSDFAPAGIVKTLHTVLSAATLLLPGQTLLLAPAEAQSTPVIIEAVTIHPPVAARFQCSEHPLGAEDHVPDALAADCVVVRRDGGPNGNLTSLYTGDGTRNEDWHSWREPLLAPFDGVVIGIRINPETTVPGVRGSGRSSAVLFQQLVDGAPTDVHVAYVHVREVTVSQGDTVRAGDAVARIGNNGSSFNPHVHVGAFRGELMSEDAVPLQVRMDLATLGRLLGTAGN